MNTKMTKLALFYKLAKPDGWDFYTGAAVNYRGAAEAKGIGALVHPPKPDQSKGLCSDGVIHASEKPNDCFIGASIPCSAYRVKGTPVCSDDDKSGFLELEVLEEVTDLDGLFGWNYTEASSPVHPFKLPKAEYTPEVADLLKQWGSVRGSVWSSVGSSVWGSVRGSVWDSVRDSVEDSVRGSVEDSVGDSVHAYIGSLFPNIEKWEGIDHESGVYPFAAGADLWRMGIVSSYDGTVWRLHSGEKADVIWEGTA